jgi:threonine synthase
VPAIAELECTSCKAKFSADHSGACPYDNCPLVVRYVPTPAKSKPDFRAARLNGMWRYSDFLPEIRPITLGEGFTPLLSSKEFPNMHIKNEAGNPTGSLEDRAMSMVVSMAIGRGIEEIVSASTEECARSLAAYSARAGTKAHVFVPLDAPGEFKLECEMYGAEVTMLAGDFNERRRIANEYAENHDAVLSESNNPFRIEGLKTLGFEILEQLQWQMPEAIICPAGDDATIIALEKAFEEMDAARWIESTRPKIVAVTTARDNNIDLTERRVVQEMAANHGWIQCAVTDATAMEAAGEWAAKEGISASHKGAALLAAYRQLRVNGTLGPGDKIVLVNTSSGRGHLGSSPRARQILASRNIGGIIGPY